MAGRETPEVQAWMRKAGDDLRAASLDLEAAPPLIEDALFHCQQAAEKAMKGFLVAHVVPFRRVHDLDELASACEAIDKTLKDTLTPARDLTVFAWEFRYPGTGDVPSEADAHEALNSAKATVAAIQKRLAQ